MTNSRTLISRDLTIQVINDYLNDLPDGEVRDGLSQIPDMIRKLPRAMGRHEKPTMERPVFTGISAADRVYKRGRHEDYPGKGEKA